MSELFFYLSMSFLLYTYAGYPMLIFVWSRLFQKPIRKVYQKPEPMVSVIIAARDEEKRIKQRIENLFLQDYPANRIEIIVISDGSKDKTALIVRSLIEKIDNKSDQFFLKLIEITENKGKSNALNLGVAEARGDFIVFADVRQSYNNKAIRELVANFSDPEVGSVSGELLFVKKSTSSVRDEIGYYWNFEKKLRKMESAIHSVPGATGAIYAIRKELYPIVPCRVILDDVFIPISIILRGYRNIFDSEALAFDIISKNFDIEKRRKVRTLVGNYQILTLIPKALFPKNNKIFLNFLSHKIFRLFIPFILLIQIVASVLSGGIIFQSYILVIATVTLFALIKPYVNNLPLIKYISVASSAFFKLNYFAILAFWHLVTIGSDDNKLW